MKKILVFGVVFTFLSAAAFAQPAKTVRDKEHFQKGFHKSELTRTEKMKLKKHDIRYKKAFRKLARDGRLTHTEKKRLYALKKHDRRETFRYTHNKRKRAI